MYVMVEVPDVATDRPTPATLKVKAPEVNPLMVVETPLPELAELEAV